jgi:hypothetical protein
MNLNRDYSDLLSAFAAAKVRFLLVGAYALSYHGRPRATGDLDVWVEPSPANARRVWAALASFGAPLKSVRVEDFSTAHSVFQIGVAPNRIDVLTSLTGLRFSEAWKNRRRASYGSIPVFVISAQDLLKNKRALGRPRDLADAEELDALLRLSRRRSASSKRGRRS